MAGSRAGIPTWTLKDGTRVQGAQYPCFVTEYVCPFDRAKRIPCDKDGGCPASPKPPEHLRA